MPKSIWQVLGGDRSRQVVLDSHNGEVIVTRVEAEHEAPPLDAFLNMVESDIRSGRHVGTLPEELAQALLAAASHGANIAEETDGDVAF